MTNTHFTVSKKKKISVFSPPGPLSSVTADLLAAGWGKVNIIQSGEESPEARNSGGNDPFWL